jgi:hypothetical protein
MSAAEPVSVPEELVAELEDALHEHLGEDYLTTREIAADQAKITLQWVARSLAERPLSQALSDPGSVVGVKASGEPVAAWQGRALAALLEGLLL